MSAETAEVYLPEFSGISKESLCTGDVMERQASYTDIEYKTVLADEIIVRMQAGCGGRL